MSDATVDDRGRLYLPKEIRQEYGDNYQIVRLPDGIKLVPVNDDPIAGLRNAMEGIEDVPLDELEDAAEAEARRQALDGVR